MFDVQISGNKYNENVHLFVLTVLPLSLTTLLFMPGVCALIMLILNLDSIGHRMEEK